MIIGEYKRFLQRDGALCPAQTNRGSLACWAAGLVCVCACQSLWNNQQLLLFSQHEIGRFGEGEIDTTFLISHRLGLEDAPEGYRNFHGNQNEWTEVVLKP